MLRTGKVKEISLASLRPITETNNADKVSPLQTQRSVKERNGGNLHQLIPGVNNRNGNCAVLCDLVGD
jgi:hypothetical protein